MEKTFSLDRFEKDVAVLIARDGGCFPVLAQVLPPDACEGDLVALHGGRWTLLREETEDLRKEMFELQEDLFNE